MVEIILQTPTSSRRNLSVLEMDQERRMRRENMQRISLQPLAEENANYKRSNSSAPFLVEEDSRSVKRRCMLEFTGKENYNDDFLDLHLPPRTSFRSLLPAIEKLRPVPMRASWNSPTLPVCNLRPRNLTADLDDSVSDKESVDSLPYMPL